VSDLWDAKSETGVKDDKLGRILLKMGLVTNEQLSDALRQQAYLNNNSKDGRKYKLGEILLFKKVIKLEQLHEALRHQTQKAYISRTSQGNLPPVVGKRLK